MDFSNLIEISDGDTEFLADFSETFESNTLPQIESMLQLFQNQNFDQLGQVAHQIKPTAELLGMASFPEIVQINDAPETASQQQIETIISDALLTIQSLKDQFLS